MKQVCRWCGKGASSFLRLQGVRWPVCGECLPIVGVVAEPLTQPMLPMVLPKPICRHCGYVRCRCASPY